MYSVLLGLWCKFVGREREREREREKEREREREREGEGGRESGERKGGAEYSA